MTLDANAQKSTFLREMIGRGHVYQITDEKGLDDYATGTPTGYIGFDCTAKSLHVGSLVQIMNLRRLQQAGGRPRLNHEQRKEQTLARAEQGRQKNHRERRIHEKTVMGDG